MGYLQLRVDGGDNTIEKISQPEGKSVNDMLEQFLHGDEKYVQIDGGQWIRRDRIVGVKAVVG
jgi:endonuclease YncB( thermonuclease family)